MPEKIKEEKHEVIVVIVNEGHSDKVMDAARDAGARGGTICHARGSGTKDMEKRYGIVITPQKEMLYIQWDKVLFSRFQLITFQE